MSWGFPGDQRSQGCFGITSYCFLWTSYLHIECEVTDMSNLFSLFTQFPLPPIFHLHAWTSVWNHLCVCALEKPAVWGPHRDGNIKILVLVHFLVPIRKAKKIIQNYLFFLSFLWILGLGVGHRTFSLYSIKTTTSMECPHKNGNPTCVWLYESVYLCADILIYCLFRK